MEEVDFSRLGTYSLYNWELFFHVPFFIANALSTNQKFEAALEWFHYIFDPTNTDLKTRDSDTPQQKYWITKPFYETTKEDYKKQKIENLLLSIAKKDNEFAAQIDEWRDDPFNPHLIAQMRTVAYQKNVLIKYIQTLIAWGDQLFARNTIETINQATQLYILAFSILGPRPKKITKDNSKNIEKTFNQLEQEGIDDFGNALEVENLVGPLPPASSLGKYHPELPRLYTLYFCIPNNEKMLSLWDTVEDRLFKIRHCMNIEGKVQQLPLFEPRIEPGLLAKAAAAGLDIGSILNDLNAPMPLYRFSFMLQKALEICNEIKSLGNALLSALEKKDAEAMSLLRSSHELTMMDAAKIVKGQQVNEALSNYNGLKESSNVIIKKIEYYKGLINDGWSFGEHTAFTLSSLSTALDVAIALGYTISGGLKLIPDFLAGVSGFGGSPTVNATIGGQQIGNGAEMAVRTLQAMATAFDKGAALASTVASYERRAAEWQFQLDLANAELLQVSEQMVAADFRHQIALQELTNHDKQKENMQNELEYMASKFTNKELYEWMISQISTVYFQSYQLAYDLAKRAEKCFRYELGLEDSNYIQFGYWDNLKKGLLAGEKLWLDLKRLETAYYEQNSREYELTKHISLAQLDPVALLKLRQNGECFFNIPETIFDLDYPGHYFRRIKTVGLSIPCVVGPYTTLACTLTLNSNQFRKNNLLPNDKYEKNPGDDSRFRDGIASTSKPSIATSNAQNDHGLFELNFKDERYLPFEGAGAISSWHIKINNDIKQFDFSSISDIIIHLNYTARDGGELLRTKAADALTKALANFNKDNVLLARVFDIKHEYSDKWYGFLHPSNSNEDQEIILDDLKDKLPFFTRSFAAIKVTQIEIMVLLKDAQAKYQVKLSPPLQDVYDNLLPLAQDSFYQGLHRATKDLSQSPVDLNNWNLKIQKTPPVGGVGDFKSLPADAIEELFLLIKYTVA